MANALTRELVRRALFGLNSVRRVARDVVGGKSVADSLSKERGNFEAHRMAQKRRLAVDRAVEAAREVYGDSLGWYLGPSENHCPICLRLAGNNFNPANPPGGLPGSIHHNCSCSSGAQFPDGKIL